MVDFEEVGGRGTELFCGMMLAECLFKSEKDRLTRGSHLEAILRKVLDLDVFSQESGSDEEK